MLEAYPDLIAEQEQQLRSVSSQDPGDPKLVPFRQKEQQEEPNQASVPYCIVPGEAPGHMGMGNSPAALEGVATHSLSNKWGWGRGPLAQLKLPA